MRNLPRPRVVTVKFQQQSTTVAIRSAVPFGYGVDNREIEKSSSYRLELDDGSPSRI